GDAVPLVGERAAGLGEEGPLVDAHRQLATLGGHDDAAYADPVAEGEIAEAGEVGGGGGEPEQLDAPAAVLERAERELALHAPQHETPRDGDDGVGLGAGLEVAPLLDELGGARVGVEPVGNPRAV